MSRAGFQPRREPKTSDLLIRQKVEAMIEYGHCALRQFPKSERHVLSAEIRSSMWALLRLVIVCNKRYYKKTTLQELDAELDLLRASVQSWVAHASGADAYGLRARLLSSLAFQRSAT